MLQANQNPFDWCVGLHEFKTPAENVGILGLEQVPHDAYASVCEHVISVCAMHLRTHLTQNRGASLTDTSATEGPTAPNPLTPPAPVQTHNLKDNVAHQSWAISLQ